MPVRFRTFTLASSTLLFLALAHTAQADDATKATATIKPSTAATTQPTANNVTGTVTFSPMGDHLMVVADVTGLTPNTEHGFHIHQKGDLSAPDLSSAGGHFNPGNTHHGAPGETPHHAGDLGNLKADAEGKAHLEIMLMGVTLGDPAADPKSILGKSVIIHAKTDDLKTDPSGNSGARVAGGVIEKAEK